MLSDRFLFQQVSGKIAIVHRTFCVRKFLETLDDCQIFAIFRCVGWNPIFLDSLKFSQAFGHISCFQNACCSKKSLITFDDFR